MGLKVKVEKLEDVEEQYRSLYIEKDGAWHLDAEGIEDAGGLQKALAAARREAKTFEGQVAAWKKLGKTPEEINEMIRAAAEAEEAKARNEGQWDKLRAQLEGNHQKAMADQQAENARLRKQIEALMVDAAATAQIADSKGSPHLLLPHVQKQTRVIEENGQFTVRVVDAKGDPRLGPKGEFMTIGELVSEMRASEQFGRAFEASGASGSGMQPTPPPSGGAGGGGLRVPTSWADAKTPQEKAEFLKTKPAAPQNR
jgi:hypothetical protein